MRENIKELDILPGRFMRVFCEDKDISLILNAQRQVQGTTKKLDESRGREDLLLMRLKHKERVGLIWLESISMFIQF